MLSLSASVTINCNVAVNLLNVHCTLKGVMMMQNFIVMVEYNIYRLQGVHRFWGVKPCYYPPFVAAFRRTHSPSQLAWSGGWRPPWRWVCIHQMNRGTLAMALPWWQHHKYHPGYYYIIIIISQLKTLAVNWAGCPGTIGCMLLNLI